MCLSLTIAFFDGLPRTLVDRYLAPQPCLLVGGWQATRVRGFVVLGCLWNDGQAIRVSNDIDRDQQARKVRAVNSASGCGNVTFHLCEQWMKLCMGQSGPQGSGFPE